LSTRRHRPEPARRSASVPLPRRVPLCVLLHFRYRAAARGQGARTDAYRAYVSDEQRDYRGALRLGTLSVVALGSFVACTGVGNRLVAQAPVRGTATMEAPVSRTGTVDGSDANAFVDEYCVRCHSHAVKLGGLALEGLDASQPADHPEVWERVVTRLRAGSMPPSGSPCPSQATYDTVTTDLESKLDSAWLASPNPGRIGPVHRLNRVEYNNAIRDLFDLELDVKPLLPGDETADGSFDNFANVLSISTAHLERYLSVSRQVTRLAVGLPPNNPTVDTFEIPLHVVQDDRQSEDLPFGTRGGMAIGYNFPTNGEYVVRIKLQRQYQDYIKGMGWSQMLDVRLDGTLVQRFKVGGEARGRPAAASYAGGGEPGFAGAKSWEEYMQVSADANLEARFGASAGSHTVGVTFVREMWAEEGLKQPVQRGRVLGNDQLYMDYAAVGTVDVGGPYGDIEPGKETPSRSKIFLCQPTKEVEELSCAASILEALARRAYRRPVTQDDVAALMPFFVQGRSDGGSFDAGVQFALERMLVDPDFLLRVYKTSHGEGGLYALSDVEVASRLSFFLWSSIPDERLLDLAERDELTQSEVLHAEVDRMLEDPRATGALVDNFAAQWLNLRRVAEVVVDPDVYPNYDLSLMQGLLRETELFVASTIEEDRSVHDLLDADYTFMNERLAQHYGVDGIYGSRFRLVQLPNHDQRGGLLSHGSLLATTSYPNRTSPVLRGKWLLDNLFATPAPPPPPGIPALQENAPGREPATIKERLALHRQSPTCKSCHAIIDPVGFALENFDVLGRWRTEDEVRRPVESVSTTASGQTINGFSGLRDLLLNPIEKFPKAVTGKLMSYALGRRLEYYDQPAVRKIVHDAAVQDYRWSALIHGIVETPAFLQRTADPLPEVAGGSE